MNAVTGGRPPAERAATKTFMPCIDVDPAEYEALALTPAEFRSMLLLSPAEWRRFLCRQGLYEQERTELTGAAEMLSALAWTARELLEQLDGICAEVGNEPSAAIALLCRRLQCHLHQLKETP